EGCNGYQRGHIGSTTDTATKIEQASNGSVQLAFGIEQRLERGRIDRCTRRDDAQRRTLAPYIAGRLAQPDPSAQLVFAGLGKRPAILAKVDRDGLFGSL